MSSKATAATFEEFNFGNGGVLTASLDSASFADDLAIPESEDDLRLSGATLVRLEDDHVVSEDAGTVVAEANATLVGHDNERILVRLTDSGIRLALPDTMMPSGVDIRYGQPLLYRVCERNSKHRYQELLLREDDEVNPYANKVRGRLADVSLDD